MPQISFKTKVSESDGEYGLYIVEDQILIFAENKEGIQDTVMPLSVFENLIKEWRSSNQEN